MNSAGIEVRETDYSDYVQSISNVSVGCVGEARRGPLEPTLVSSQEELIKVFGEPTEGKYGIYGAFFALSKVNSLYYQRIVGAESSIATAGLATNRYTFESKNPDSTINGATIKISDADAFGYRTLTLTGADGQVIELFSNLTDDVDDDRYLVKFINTNSSRVKVELNKTEEDELITDPTDTVYTFAGGDDGISTITPADILGVAAEGTGMQSFSNPETVEINLLMTPGITEATVVAGAVALAESRGDILYVVDTPAGLSAQQATDFANATGTYNAGYALNSSYAAVYYPWVKVNDPFTKQEILMPPSGAVVAQVAYSDSQSYAWFAPAGLNRGIMTEVVGLERSPSQGERDLLYGNRNCINPIVKFAGTGIVIWGQKTTQRKCSALDRVNVRRLMNYLKKMITASSRYYLFEPNDNTTWNKWIDMVQASLNTVKSQRGIYAIKVEMKPTEAQIDNYEMPGTIKIKPSKSAEFMTLDFMIMPTDASFDENNI